MRILSLDIGSSSIKAVEIDSSFGRIELLDYFIEKVPQAEVAESEANTLLTTGQVEAIRSILGGRAPRYEKLVVNIPSALTTTRVFQFPTKERKVIQSSLGFELEDEIPFPLDQSIYDFAILNSEGAGSTVFSAVALRSDISRLISELQMIGLDPDMITVDAWAMGQLLKRVAPPEYDGRPICLLDMGSTQTSIHVYLQNQPLMSHVCSVGGIDLTRAMTMAYSLGFADAEAAKQEGAFIVTQAHLDQGIAISEEQMQFSAVISEALFPIIREVKQTLMSFKSQTKQSPRAIFVSGGTSLIPNLALYLEEQLRIPVFPLMFSSRLVGQTLQLSEVTEPRIAQATALCLAVAKVERNSSINLRKDDLGKAGTLGFNFKAFARPLKYAAAALAFVYVNLFLQWLVLSARVTAQEGQFERAIKSVVGAVSTSVMNTYLASPSALKSAVKKELAKYKEAAPVNVKTQVSALDVLNKVSSGMPRDMTLDVNIFEIKDGRFKLTGVVDHMINADRIAKALEDTKLVADISKNKPEEDPKTKKTKFEITAKVAEAISVKTH